MTISSLIYGISPKILNKSVINKTILLIALCMYICLVFIFGLSDTVHGNEQNFLDYFPIACLFIIGILGLSPLIYLLITRLTKSSFFSWKCVYGLLIIAIMTWLLFESFPNIHGYLTFGGGDTLTHLGIIKDILQFGNISMFYPALHVSIAIGSLLTNISIEMVSYHYVIILFIIFISFSYLLSRSFTQNKENQVVVVCLAALLIFTVYQRELLSPNQTGFCFLPLYCYLLYKFINAKTHHISYGISISIISIFFWYIHPETVIYASIITLCVCIMSSIYAKKHNIRPNVGINSYIFLLGVLCCGFIYTFSLFPAFSGQTNLYWNIIIGLGGSDKTTLAFAMNSMYSIPELVILGFEKVGFHLFYIIPAYICMIYYFISHQKSNDFRHLMLYFVLVIITLYIIINIIGGTTVSSNPERLLKALSLVSIFIIGIAVDDIIRHRIFMKTGRKIVIFILTLAIICACVFSLGTAYGNTYFNSYSAEVSESDYSGMVLFYQYNNDIYLIDELYGRQIQDRYFTYIYGDNAFSHAYNVRPFYSKDSWSTFYNLFNDYDSIEYIGQLYPDKTYFLVFHPHGEIQRFGITNDLIYGGLSNVSSQRLKMDISINQIIDGVLSIYLINPISNSSKII